MRPAPHADACTFLSEALKWIESRRVHDSEATALHPTNPRLHRYMKVIKDDVSQLIDPYLKIEQGDGTKETAVAK
jgi:hypothetical protein